VHAIITDDRIDSCVKLYAADLKTAELALRPNVVNVIIRYPAESSSHASAYSGLLAVEYCVISHDVRADSFFGPAKL
jgi:hypothetical protein